MNRGFDFPKDRAGQRLHIGDLIVPYEDFDELWKVFAVGKDCVCVNPVEIDNAVATEKRKPNKYKNPGYRYITVFASKNVYRADSDSALQRIRIDSNEGSVNITLTYEEAAKILPKLARCEFDE